jgi:hypothetical protein
MWPAHFCGATVKHTHDYADRLTHCFCTLGWLFTGLAHLPPLPPEKDPAPTGSVSPVFAGTISLCAAYQLCRIWLLQNSRFPSRIIHHRNRLLLSSFVPLGCDLGSLGGQLPRRRVTGPIRPNSLGLAPRIDLNFKSQLCNCPGQSHPSLTPRFIGCHDRPRVFFPNAKSGF